MRYNVHHVKTVQSHSTYTCQSVHIPRHYRYCCCRQYWPLRCLTQPKPEILIILHTVRRTYTLYPATGNDPCLTDRLTALPHEHWIVYLKFQMLHILSSLTLFSSDCAVCHVPAEATARIFLRIIIPEPCLEQEEFMQCRPAEDYTCMRQALSFGCIPDFPPRRQEYGRLVQIQCVSCQNAHKCHRYIATEYIHPAAVRSMEGAHDMTAAM